MVYPVYPSAVKTEPFLEYTSSMQGPPAAEAPSQPALVVEKKSLLL